MRIILVASLLLTGCGKFWKKDALPDEEKAYYSATIHAAYRPLISTNSRMQALQWVYGSQISEDMLAEKIANPLNEGCKWSAMTIRALVADKVSLETRALAEEIAARRSATSLSFSGVRRPDAGVEFIGWLVDAASVDERYGDEQERDDLRMRMGLQRIGNYAQGVARAKLQEQQNANTFQQYENEIMLLIEKHRIALGGAKALQLGSVASIAGEILAEQTKRAEQVSRQFDVKLVEGTLLGSSSATWNNFEAGEIKAYRTVESKVIGHCIVTDAEIDVVGRINGARKLRVKMAHEVYIDGTVRLLAIR